MISILFFNWLHKKREHKTPVATGNCSSHRFHYRLTGCHTPTNGPSAATPCMNDLPLFTAAHMPAFAPGEIACSEGYTNGFACSGLPGNGVAEHPLLYVVENCNKMFLVNNGKVIWTYATGSGPEFDDV